MNWALVNFRVLSVFGPVLIATGIGGFLIPPRFALMSGAPAYNVFHILFGMLGTGLVVTMSTTGIMSNTCAYVIPIPRERANR